MITFKALVEFISNKCTIDSNSNELKKIKG